MIPSTMHADQERVRSALSCLDFSDRDVWVRAAMCLKSEFGDDGFEIWDSWGSKHGAYSASSAMSVWRSVKASGPTTIASLFYDAKAAGWKDDAKHTKPSREEIERRKAAVAKRQAEATAEDAIARRSAADLARFMWDKAQPCEGDGHPYLQRKRVKSHGLRVGSWVRINRENGAVETVSHQALLIPIRDAKKNIHSLQAIFTGKVYGGRDKDFVKDGAISGLFYSFGKPLTVDVRGEQRQVILIGEGYATLASAHEATGHACIVALNAGNLVSVAKTIRMRFPDAHLVIFSDRDAESLRESVGTRKAVQAAYEIGGSVAVVVPEWVGPKGRDANDIARLGFSWGGKSYPGDEILRGCVNFATPYRSPAFMELLRECGIDAEDLVPVPAVCERTEPVPAGQSKAAGGAVALARDEDRRREQQEENKRIQDTDAGVMIPSDLSVDAMIEHCIWVADGRNVAYVTEDRSMFLKFEDFKALTISSNTELEVQQREKQVKKLFPNANLWQADLRRIDAMTVTFRPGASIITANPKGLRAVNTWRPIHRWPATEDITPFLEQVEYLFPDLMERDAFLDWLAHIEQKPGELPHYGWLHIAENTGTGRNWMASVLARVFRGYVAPNVDLPGLLDSPYNGELGGCVLAIVDEVQEGASEGNCRHAERLKSMVNAEMRTVNNKYGLKYIEFNAMRWLVFSNHKNALPLNDEDRRFRVVMHKAPPRAPEAYEHLYSLLSAPEFINSVGVYLSERNISCFRPGERPPLNADKLAAIAASKPTSTLAAEEIVAWWPADVITYKDAAALITGAPDRNDFQPALRRAMESAGALAWQQGTRIKIKLGSMSHRLWVLRNHAKWLGEGTEAVRKEILRAGVDEPTRPAAAVLADAAEAADGIRAPQF